MEKRLFVQLNGNRKVIGILRGYDVSLFSCPLVPPLPFYNARQCDASRNHIPRFRPRKKHALGPGWGRGGIGFSFSIPIFCLGIVRLKHESKTGS